MSKGGRPPKYDWKEIKEAYECGLVVDELCDKYDIDKKTLQNKISKELWEVMGSIKSEISNVKQSLGKISGTIAQNPEKAHIIAEEILDSINSLAERIDAKKLIHGATKINLTRTIQYLQNNVKLEKMNVGDGIQQFEEVGLGSSDFKNIQDTIDKSAVTLELAPRHANQQINVNTQNNNAQIIVTKEEIKEVISSFDDEY